jgi:hypothetical protein
LQLKQQTGHYTSACHSIKGAGDENMLVVRNDNHYDCAIDTMPDGLIKSGEIVKFRHNTEWAGDFPLYLVLPVNEGRNK